LKISRALFSDVGWIFWSWMRAWAWAWAMVMVMTTTTTTTMGARGVGSVGRELGVVVVVVIVDEYMTYDDLR